MPNKLKWNSFNDDEMNVKMDTTRTMKIYYLSGNGCEGYIAKNTKTGQKEIFFKYLEAEQWCEKQYEGKSWGSE